MSSGALFARNPWNQPFPGVAFADLRGAQTEFTCDRREFLGRHGTLDAPAALVSGAPFSGRAGAGLDPCAALRARIELEPASSTEFVFLLGEAADGDAARALLTRYRSADVDAVLDAVRAHWEKLTGHVQVKTPDRAFDIMMNGWLLYQTLACRTWARAGFYQASGAYGFRDQLQDAMALGLARPQLLREQILRAAARQFPEGDVQHWWLPHNGQGVRTHISDDRVWLSFVTAHYVALTGDRAILDVQLPFIEGPPLPRERHDAFFEPGDQRADRDPVRALPAAVSKARCTGHAWPAADRHRRLERRHESRRRTRPRRKRLARLVPARHAQCVRAASRRRAANSRSPPPGSARPRGCAPRSNNMPGMANGIGADSSTTARRSARPPTMNARSMPSRSPGA